MPAGCARYREASTTPRALPPAGAAPAPPPALWATDVSATAHQPPPPPPPPPCCHDLGVEDTVSLKDGEELKKTVVSDCVFERGKGKGHLFVEVDDGNEMSRRQKN